MSFLPPSPPRFGSPGGIQPTTLPDWVSLSKFFNNLCLYLQSISSAPRISSPGGAGNLIGVQPFSGPSLNLVLLYCDALTGAVTYTFPQTFTFLPVVLDTNGLPTSVVTALSTTAVTITGSASTGFIVIIGF